MTPPSLPYPAAEARTNAKTPVAMAIAERAKPVPWSVPVASVSINGADAPPPAADCAVTKTGINHGY